MHPDEGAADVEARIGPDMLDGYGGLERLVAGGRERPARLGLRDNVHDFGVRDGLVLDDDGTVQVLAALCGDIDAARCEDSMERFENDLARFGYGMTPELLSECLACAATDDDNLALAQVRRLDEFLCRTCRIAADLLQNALVFDLVSYACHFLRPFFTCVK